MKLDLATLERRKMQTSPGGHIPFGSVRESVTEVDGIRHRAHRNSKGTRLWLRLAGPKSIRRV